MTDATLDAPQNEMEASFGDYFALLKPRVMILVVFTALVGLLAAPVPLHWVVAFASILFIFLLPISSSSSGNSSRQNGHLSPPLLLSLA